jgi:hypothetical protein
MDANLSKAARNHCDSHRRYSDEVRTRELIAGQKQARANAEEWLRRSHLAYEAGMVDLCNRLFDQAKLELMHTPWEHELDGQALPGVL